MVLKKVWSGWGISQICRELKSHHLPEDIHIVHLFEALNQCQKNAGTPPPNIRGHGQVTMKQPGEDSEASWSSRSVLGVGKSTSHQCLVLFSLGGLVVGRLSCCSFSLGDLLFAKLYDLGKTTPESKQHRRIQFFGPKINKFLSETVMHMNWGLSI